jgi:hypothetical protein
MQLLKEMPDESIYDGKRLAQPDEVWNFKRGDGIEKAILLANFILNTIKNAELQLNIKGSQVVLKQKDKQYIFNSKKEFEQKEIKFPL